MLDTLGGGATLGQAELEVVLHGSEQVLEALCCPIEEPLQEGLLVGLQAAGHAVFVDAAAAVEEAAFAHVLPGARGVDVTAPVHQQVLSFTDVTQFIREKRLSLNRVPTLRYLPAAVAQIEPNLPCNAVLGVPSLQQGAITYCPLLLFQGAGQKVDQ